LFVFFCIDLITNYCKSIVCEKENQNKKNTNFKVIIEIKLFGWCKLFKATLKV